MKSIVLFLFWPDAVWRHLRARPQPVGRLLLAIALPFALGIGVAVQLGLTVFNVHWSPQWGYNPQPLYGDATAPLAAILSLAAPFALAAVFTWMAPSCGVRAGFRLCANLAVYGMLPFWLSSLGLFFMADIVLCLAAAAWSCVLFVRGARVLLQMTLDDSAQFVMGAIMAMGGLFSVLGLGLGSLLA